MGSKIKSIETKDIAYFYVLEKSTFLKTIQGRDYPIDFSLDKQLKSLKNKLANRCGIPWGYPLAIYTSQPDYKAKIYRKYSHIVICRLGLYVTYVYL